jgi:hypothetical protein
MAIGIVVNLLAVRLQTPCEFMYMPQAIRAHVSGSVLPPLLYSMLHTRAGHMLHRDHQPGTSMHSMSRHYINTLIHTHIHTLIYIRLCRCSFAILALWWIIQRSLDLLNFLYPYLTAYIHTYTASAPLPHWGEVFCSHPRTSIDVVGYGMRVCIVQDVRMHVCGTLYLYCMSYNCKQQAGDLTSFFFSFQESYNGPKIFE